MNKTGILPIFTPENGEPLYLLYRPKPKHDPNAVLPYQLARGTIEAGEDMLSAAKREAEEELGVELGVVKLWHDAGLFPYTSDTKGTYDIHWCLAELTHQTPTEPLPQDAAGLIWMTKDEVLNAMVTGEVKANYREIFLKLSEFVAPA